jgi:hypothetical protein
MCSSFEVDFQKFTKTSNVFFLRMSFLFEATRPGNSTIVLGIRMGLVLKRLL